MRIYGGYLSREVTEEDLPAFRVGRGFLIHLRLPRRVGYARVLAGIAGPAEVAGLGNGGWCNRHRVGRVGRSRNASPAP